MSNERDQEIISIFTFSDIEYQIYSFLFDYHNLITNWLKENSFDEGQLLRFIIISFFPYYRGCVHRGDDFTTHVRNIEKNNDDKKKIHFNKIFGKEINTTQEYLQLLPLKNLNNINAKSLFEFVIYGNKIN